MALDTAQVVRIYTTRLVNSLVPQEFGDEYIQSVTKELLRVFLSSSQPSGYNIDSVLNQFKRMFISTGRTTEWTRFQQIIESLINLKSVDQVKNYLVFLSLVKGEDILSPTSAPLPKLSYQKQGFQHIQDSHHTQTGFHAISAPDIRPRSQFGAGDDRFELQSSPYNKPANLTNPTFTNINGTVMEELIKPYYETLNEQQILKYLPYTLLGVDSKIFTFSNHNDVIKLEIPHNINNSYSSLLGQIIEPALIFVKLKGFLATNFGSSSSVNDLSPIKVSYLTLLDKELNDYGNFINQMFNDQNIDSLIKIYHEIYPKVLKLRLFYSLTTHLTLLGYDFLTKIHELTKFGDPLINQTALEIFDNISTPYYEILEHWIIRGDLIDTNNDFFIEFDKDQRHINDIIKYLPQKVPNFFITINKDIGFKIFQIGKILIFLNQYCKELNWVNNYINKYSKRIYTNQGGLKLANVNSINDLINDQYHELVNYFTYILHGKYELINHLDNYRKFLLMGSNDFVDSLIIKGNELFNEPSNQLTSNQLGKILIDSINFSSIRNYNLDFKNRLDARILDLSHGSIGWQVFTIEYNLNDLPINHIINYNNMGLEYLKMFNFLWKLKQFNYLLMDNYLESNNVKKNDLKQFYNRYKKLMKANSSTKNLKDYKIEFIIKSFRMVNMMRYKLIKFLNLIIEYIVNEIDMNYSEMVSRFYLKNQHGKKIQINKAFLDLIKPNKLENNSQINNNLMELNFDEVLELNSKYVNKLNFKLLDGSVIGKSNESYINQIYQLLETIFQFIKSNEEFISLLVNYVSLLNIDKNLAVNDLDTDLDDIEINLKQIFQKMYKQIFKSFNDKYAELVKDLRNDLELKEFAKLF